ncbi:MAG: amidohydrolase [bacterium]
MPGDAPPRYRVPAFHDAHVHLTQTGLARSRVALGRAASRDELLARLSAALDAPRACRILVGEGADESGWADAALPTRDDLDRISRDVPVIVRRVCLHKAVANSAALALLDCDDPEVDAGSGVLVEGAVFSLDEKLLAPALEDRIPAILLASRLSLSRGVTAADEISSWPSVLAVLRLAEEGRLPMRIRMHVLYPDLERARALGLASRARVGSQGWGVIGGIKLFLDGSLGARTAALREPYADDASTRGLLLMDAPTLAARIREIESAGFYALVHVIGDAALDTALDAFEAARIAPGNPLGHRLEHVEIVPDDRTLDRLVRLGLHVVAQPNFVGNWGWPGGLYEQRLGPDRLARMNRFASLRDAGVPLRFSSDAMPINPLYGIQSAVSHPNTAEQLDALDAFARYSVRGNDSIDLSAPPELAAIDPSTRVLAAAIDGKIVYTAEDSASDARSDAKAT